MITIRLSIEEAEQLLSELYDGESHRWSDDNTHADDCPSKVVFMIEEQVREQSEQS